jgi:hypothetical protein
MTNHPQTSQTPRARAEIRPATRHFAEGFSQWTHHNRVRRCASIEALEKEANRVAAQAESRTRGVRIVSANGRFAAHAINRPY